MPTSLAALINLPPELIHRIVDFLDIRDALNMAETCLYFQVTIDTAEFWRHRLMRDYRCYSFSIKGCSDESLPVYRESYI